MSKEVKPTTGNGLETEMQVLKNNNITNNSSDKKEETPLRLNDNPPEYNEEHLNIDHENIDKEEDDEAIDYKNADDEINKKLLFAQKKRLCSTAILSL